VEDEQLERARHALDQGEEKDRQAQPPVDSAHHRHRQHSDEVYHVEEEMRMGDKRTC
jgi:hypothetical protein